MHGASRTAVRFAIAAGILLLGGFIAFSALDDAACRAQMDGTGPNRPGSDCGYRVAQESDEFRYAIDDGSQRLLYLSGGSEDAPVEIRLLHDNVVVVSGPTEILTADRNIDVCRNQPPRDHRWWSAPIDEELAQAIRTGDARVRLEGLINGGWLALQIHDSGCKWRGHA